MQKQIPTGPKENQANLQRSGLFDMKYLVWQYKNVRGRAISEAELSFTGPRRGVASWLASPRSLGSLDFVSPKAIMAASLVLTNPAQIFENVQQLVASSNPNAFAVLAQSEQALRLSLKDDLLSRLDGEITLELDSVNPPEPEWKVILKVNDPGHLQQTFKKLIATANMQMMQSEEGGITYYSLQIPSPNKAVSIGYAFVDGYLIMGPSHASVAESIRLHTTGESLAKSPKFLASLPPGHPSEVSALLYEDPIAVTAMSLARVSPEIVGTLGSSIGPGAPIVVCAYGEQSAIREVTASAPFDPAMFMVVAAVAIPNLLRARDAANESSAVATLRTLNVAQVVYAGTYPRRGYAPDLAALGPDPRGATIYSSRHASLIDSTLGNPSCTAGSWCIKSGYRFAIRATCGPTTCKDFVALGTPVSSATGTKNFCSTSEGVIRFKPGPPLTSAISASECGSWPPLR